MTHVDQVDIYSAVLSRMPHRTRSDSDRPSAVLSVSSFPFHALFSLFVCLSIAFSKTARAHCQNRNLRVTLYHRLLLFFLLSLFLLFFCSPPHEAASPAADRPLPLFPTCDLAKKKRRGSARERERGKEREEKKKRAGGIDCNRVGVSSLALIRYAIRRIGALLFAVWAYARSWWSRRPMRRHRQRKKSQVSADDAPQTEAHDSSVSRCIASAEVYRGRGLAAWRDWPFTVCAVTPKPNDSDVSNDDTNTDDDGDNNGGRGGWDYANPLDAFEQCRSDLARLFARHLDAHVVWMETTAMPVWAVSAVASNVIKEALPENPASSSDESRASGSEACHDVNAKQCLLPDRPVEADVGDDSPHCALCNIHARLTLHHYRYGVATRAADLAGYDPATYTTTAWWSPPIDHLLESKSATERLAARNPDVMGRACTVNRDSDHKIARLPSGHIRRARSGDDRAHVRDPCTRPRPNDAVTKGPATAVYHFVGEDEHKGQVVHIVMPIDSIERTDAHAVVAVKGDDPHAERERKGVDLRDATTQLLRCADRVAQAAVLRWNGTVQDVADQIERIGDVAQRVHAILCFCPADHCPNALPLLPLHSIDADCIE